MKNWLNKMSLFLVLLVGLFAVEVVQQANHVADAVLQGVVFRCLVNR